MTYLVTNILGSSKTLTVELQPENIANTKNGSQSQKISTEMYLKVYNAFK